MRGETIEQYLRRQLELTSGYDSKREQDYLLGRTSLIRELLDNFYEEDTDPAQLELDLPPNCS